MNSDPSREDTLSAAADLDATIRMDVRATLPVGMEQPGDMIGRYKLIEPLGEGGFGSVWRAEQNEPIRREVALKVIKAGMDSREIIARFEAERQALALMDHPNIAGVLDAGTTDSGRPFFVMELVKGVPITHYCDAHHFTIRQRLELFIPVCQAVQHAHQKAILHRDLKPSNILVMEVDGKPVPKVIDFGIAKALQTTAEPALHATLAQTIEGMIVGTPQYMSPEQAGSMPDVDTRSDVYTLGVILYELLVGETPLSRGQMKKAALDEVLRQVRESEPRRPSSKFTPATKMVRTTASMRHSEPKKLGQALRGDLDWIVLKALEKDRSRRYDTVNALAQDVQRHLNDEVVNAGPPSVAYRLRKMVRRNRMAFMSAAALIVVLVAGIMASMWQASRALKAEALAVTALHETEAQKNLLEASRKETMAQNKELMSAQKEILAQNTALERAEKELRTKNAEFSRQLELAALTDRLSAQDLLSQGRAPEALLFLLRSHSYAPQSTQAIDMAVATLDDWQFPLPEAVCAGHSAIINCARFSPDGKFLVTASDDNTAILWDALTGRALVTFRGHHKKVNDVCFSPDGRYLISASSDGTAQLWDAKSGVSMQVFKGHERGVNSVAISHDGFRIVTASDDWSARVWETSSGKLLNVLATKKGSLGHVHPVSQGRFSPDGRHILTFADSENEARIWESHSGNLLAVLWGHKDRLTHAGFNQDGSKIATSSFDGTAKVWQVPDGKLLINLQGHQACVTCVKFSSNSSILVTASTDKTARIWNAATGIPLTELRGHEKSVNNVDFSSDGKLIVTSSDDQTARIWESINGGLQATLEGHDKNVTMFQLSPDGKYVVTASEDAMAQIWLSETRNLVTKVRVPEPQVKKVEFSMDGLRIATVCQANSKSVAKQAHIWDSSTGSLLAIIAGKPGDIDTVQFSPDGSRIVTGSQIGSAKLWDVFSGKAAGVIGQHGKRVNHSQFSHDGRFVVTSSDDHSAQIWNIQGGALVTSLDRHVNSVQTAIFSFDDRQIVTASKDKTARLWDATTGTLLATIRGHDKSVIGAQLSTDGKQVITISEDGTARLWATADGRQLRLFHGHDATITDAHLSFDGRYVVTCSYDKTARVWGSADGKPHAVFKGHEDKVNSVRFSPDGLRVATASDDGTARIWEFIDSDEPRPAWLPDFFNLMSRRKFNDHGGVTHMSIAEFMLLRSKLENIVNSERSRYAAIARWFVTPAHKRPIRPGRN